MVRDFGSLDMYMKDGAVLYAEVCLLMQEMLLH